MSPVIRGPLDGITADEVFKRIVEESLKSGAHSQKLGVKIPNITITLGDCFYCGELATASCCPEREHYLTLPPEKQEELRRLYTIKE